MTGTATAMQSPMHSAIGSNSARRALVVLLLAIGMFLGSIAVAPESEASAKKCKQSFGYISGKACVVINGSGTYVDRAYTKRSFYIPFFECDYSGQLRFTNYAGTTYLTSNVHTGCLFVPGYANRDVSGDVGFWPDPTDVRGYWKSSTVYAGWNYIRKATIHS